MDHLSTVDGKLMMGFLENSPNVKGNGPDWLFDVDSLSISMNNVPICLAEIKLMVFCKTIDRHYHKVSEEDAEEKPTEMDKSRASDKDGEDDQATRIIILLKLSNAYEEQLFEKIFSFQRMHLALPTFSKGDSKR
ncbi:hypothetical protein Tco_0122155 [Tanacetum coccineum]